MVVVDAVRGEERGRNGERAEHEGAMRTDPFPADAVKTREQQDRRDGIQYRIERRQRVIRKHSGSKGFKFSRHSKIARANHRHPSPSAACPIYSTDAALSHMSLVRAASLADPAHYVPQMVIYSASAF
jgi:hypothetical protein